MQSSNPVFVAVSESMQHVVELASRAAVFDAAVLITGETDTGKELVARAAHSYSARAGGPWVDFNCAAFPEHLIESELFGYEPGAFSGAMKSKPGLFELASGGSLFLDEIGELPPGIQAKLLRVLDGVPYLRLGGVKRIEPDVRIIAATNRKLEKDCETGRFRPDLFFRLNQVRIHIPPLRDRREDILPLAAKFLGAINPDLRLSPAAEEALESYPWPGNARELRSMLIAASLTARDCIVRPEHFGDRMAAQDGALAKTLPAMERQVILEAIRKTRGNRSRAAELVGISRRTLTRRLREYGQTEQIAELG